MVKYFWTKIENNTRYTFENGRHTGFNTLRPATRVSSYKSTRGKGNGNIWGGSYHAIADYSVYSGSTYKGRLIIHIEYGNWRVSRNDLNLRWTKSDGVWTFRDSEADIERDEREAEYEEKLQQERRATEEAVRAAAQAQREKQAAIERAAKQQAEAEAKEKEQKILTKIDTLKASINEEIRVRLTAMERLVEVQQDLGPAEQKLLELGREVEDAKKKCEMFRMPNFGGDEGDEEDEKNVREPRRIVMLGRTGDGKSTLCNRLMGDGSLDGDEGGFVAADSTRSVTQGISTDFKEYGDETFCVVDTPGLCDSGGNDRDHSLRLVTMLESIESIDSFLLVRKFVNRRIDESDKKVFASLANLLGDAFWANVVVVLTFVEGKKGLRDFDRVKKTFAQELADALGLDRSVTSGMKVIGVGSEKFDEEVGEIFDASVACNGGEKFVCERLTSPLEGLEADFATQEENVNELMAKRDELKRTCEDCQAKINKGEVDLVAEQEKLRMFYVQHPERRKR